MQVLCTATETNVTSSLEIGDNFIAWTTKPLSQQDYHRLVQTLAPTAVAYSFWASCRHLFDLQANKVKELFGVPAHPNQPSLGIPSTSHVEQKPRATNDSRLTSTGETPHASENEPRTPQSQPEDNPGSVEGDEQVEVPQLPGITTEQPQSRALATFFHALSLHRKPGVIEPPRGSIILSGLIEVIGAKARITVDVTAAYDLVTDRYLFVGMRARRLAELKQRPRG
jgi:hypothetical protein